jgi:hypothetical protein
LLRFQVLFRGWKRAITLVSTPSRLQPERRRQNLENAAASYLFVKPLNDTIGDTGDILATNQRVAR